MWTWKEEHLSDMMHMMWEMRILLTSVELGIFDLLKEGPLSGEKVAKRLDLSQRGVELLLNALCGMELMEKKEDHYYYSLAEFPRKHLCSGSPQSYRARALLASRLWGLWSNLTEVVREGKSAKDIFALSETPPEQMASFAQAMYEISKDRAQKVAQAISSLKFNSLLDVGAGPGTYTIAFLKDHPETRATVFDLPPVIDVARIYVEQEELQDRVSFVEGNFEEDPLPKNHDLIYLSAIIHINNIEKNEALFQKCWESLEPGGALLIRDYILENTKTKPRRGAVFAVNMLVATQGGKNYTLEELEQSLKKCGFEDIHFVEENPEGDSLLLARKPG